VSSPPDAEPARERRSETVHRELRRAILDGSLPAESEIPSERVLSERFGVNRHAVREAIKRLEQARLVSVSHGAATRVLDWRANAGLDLLPDLAIGGEVLVDPDLIRSVLEMRRCVGIDAARLCAQRADEVTVGGLRTVVERVRSAVAGGTGAADLAEDYDQFWRTIVRGSGNVAYQLADNTLVDAFVTHRELTVQLSASEITDADAQGALADAIAAGDADRAADLADELLGRMLAAALAQPG
jgi:DNA-binding FadR family transcriptional regulator